MAMASRATTAAQKSIVSPPGRLACSFCVPVKAFFVALIDIDTSHSLPLLLIQRRKGEVQHAEASPFLRCITLATHEERWPLVVAHECAATSFIHRQNARFDSPSNVVERTVAVAGAAYQDMAVAIFAIAIFMTVTIAQHVLKLGHDQAGNAPRIGLVDNVLEVFGNQLVAFDQGF